MLLSPQHRRPAHTSVNPSAIPALHSNTPRTNLNNPEQIRTNPNIAKPPRPDRDTPRITPEHPEKKQNPNTAAAPSPPLPQFIPPPFQGGG